MADETNGETRMPVLTSLEQVRALVMGESRPVYVRYSRGPEADGNGGSLDDESGLELPGLSVNPVNPEEWWTRPVEDWIARQLCQYAHLSGGSGGAEGRRPWLLTGRVVGAGPDCEPLIADPEPLAWVDDAVVDEADEVYTTRFDRHR
jgi:hypothetical protein